MFTILFEKLTMILLFYIFNLAGTRFYVRGLDNEGQVANFVETEQIVCFQGDMASYVQVKYTDCNSISVACYKTKIYRVFTVNWILGFNILMLDTFSLYRLSDSVALNYRSF